MLLGLVFRLIPQHGVQLSINLQLLQLIKGAHLLQLVVQRTQKRLIDILSNRPTKQWTALRILLSPGAGGSRPLRLMDLALERVDELLEVRVRDVVAAPVRDRIELQAV